MEVLKVSANSQPKSVAGAIAAVVRERRRRDPGCWGGGRQPNGQIHRDSEGYVSPNGIDLVCIPSFAKIDIDGEERTAMKFQLENR